MANDNNGDGAIDDGDGGGGGVGVGGRQLRSVLEYLTWLLFRVFNCFVPSRGVSKERNKMPQGDKQVSGPAEEPASRAVNGLKKLDGAPAGQPQQHQQVSQVSVIKNAKDVSGPDDKRTARSGSVVSFKERCQLYEVDLEAAKGRQQTKRQINDEKRPAQKPPAALSLRYYIMVLALVSPFIVTYSKTIINFAIIDMIHPDFVGRKTTPAIENPLAPADGSRAAAYFDQDNSCPVSEQVRTRLLDELSEDKRRASETTGEKFEWDTDKQGLLKAAYSIGHMFLQVLGGRLSEIYGPQLIMSLSSALIALACLSAPFLASTGFYLLFADLFVLGILGGFMTPSLITLFTKWLTPSEKSMMMNFYLISSRLGYALSSLLCGLLIDAQLSWRYLFYSGGWVALAFALLFFLCARNTPQEHPLIGQAELDYLAVKNTLVREALTAKKLSEGSVAELKPVETNGATVSGSTGGHQKAQVDIDQKAQAKKSATTTTAPWGAILTNAPVWAFVITKFCVKLAGDTVQIELPAYLKRVMHLEPKYNGYINSANYVIFCVSCLAVGLLAKSANKQRPFGWSKSVIRKLFQGTASFGVALVLLGASFAVCNETWTLGLFMGMFFFTTFSTGGEAQIPLDLSERYAGTIHALGSSLAISGAIEPIIVGYFLRGHSSDRDRWAYIWIGAGGMGLLGGLIFLIFGEAKIQPFDGGEHAKPQREVDAREPVVGSGPPNTQVVDLEAGHDNKTFVPDLVVADTKQEADSTQHSKESKQI